MDYPLTTYLHDHLAGSQIAMELLRSIEDRHRNEDLGRFAGRLLQEVERDRDLLRRFAEEQQGSATHAMKELGGWVAEKGIRLKLGSGGGNDFEIFETLEFLSLGISGKLSLWRALEVVLPAPARIADHELQALIADAQDQFARVEKQRLAWAPAALRPARPE